MPTSRLRTWRHLVAAGVLSAGVLQTQPLPAEGFSRIDYVWKPVAIGGGGFITGYSFDRSGATRVIRSDVYGAYIWSNADQKWRQLVTASAMPKAEVGQRKLSDGVYEIAVAPSDPNRIYIALTNTIYRSDDRGGTFKAATLTRPLRLDANSPFRNYGPFMAASPANENLVLLGTPSDGLLRSEDGGVHWSRVESVPAAGSAGVLVWFAPANDGDKNLKVLALSSGQGMFASSDGGRNFHPVAPPAASQPRTLKEGAFDSRGDFFGVDPVEGKVWRLRGDSWTVVGAAFSGRPLAALAINSLTDQIFLFDEGGRIFRSDDRGGQWAELGRSVHISDGDPPWLTIPGRQAYFATGKVVFDPAVANRMIAANGIGVFFADVRKDDAQIAWKSQVRGIEELVANDIVQSPGQAPLFAAWDFGVHVKPDLDAFSTTYGPKRRVLIAAQQLDWCAAKPAFIVTNASDTRMSCCSEDGDAVLAGYSEDGGKSWKKFPSLPQPPGTRADDPWRMSFGTIAVSSNDPNNIIWAPTFDRSPFYTRDRGASWRQVRLPGEVAPFTGSHEKYFYNRKTLAADRVLPNTFYWVHSGDGANGSIAGLWRTSDGGESWRKVFAGEIAPGSRFSARLRAAPGRAGELFFTSALTEGVDLALRRSHDGGASWSIVPGVEAVEDIGFGKAVTKEAYPVLFIAGRVNGVYGLWRSDDNAASWASIGAFPLDSLDQVNLVAGSLDRPGLVFVGFKGSGFAYGAPAR